MIDPQRVAKMTEDRANGAASPDDEEVARLAALSPIQYEREREDAAVKLGMRVSVLDKLVAKARGESDDGSELFPPITVAAHPVDGAALLNEMTALFRRHLVLPAGAAETMALWVLHAHTHDTSEISPILCFTSPTPECGKTTSLSLLGKLVPKALTGSNLSSAVVYRAVEKWRPTLIIDEADSFLRDNEELRGVLNSGHARAGAFILRVVGDSANMEPARFSTWAPKVIALIGKMPATLESRAVHVEMRRMAPGEQVEPFRAERVDLSSLLGRAARWAQDNDAALRDAEPDLPEALGGRRADNWRHLIAIADLAGGHWPETTRAAAITDAAKQSESTLSILLLADIKAVFEKLGDDKITTADLLDRLTADETKPWGEWAKGKAMTPRQLARLLQPFGIAPSTVRTAAGTPKGYKLEGFTDVFDRYLGNLSATRHNPQKTAEIRTLRSATPSAAVADENTQKAKESAACGGVADENPPRGEEGEDDHFTIPDFLRRDEDRPSWEAKL